MRTENFAVVAALGSTWIYEARGPFGYLPEWPTLRLLKLLGAIVDSFIDFGAAVCALLIAATAIRLPGLLLATWRRVSTRQLYKERGLRQELLVQVRCSLGKWSGSWAAWPPAARHGVRRCILSIFNSSFVARQSGDAYCYGPCVHPVPGAAARDDRPHPIAARPLESTL
eukprot:SAG11_NODE_1280_length_5314_cov_2.956472_2_plen_170_part_00